MAALANNKNDERKVPLCITDFLKEGLEQNNKELDCSISQQSIPRANPFVGCSWFKGYSIESVRKDLTLQHYSMILFGNRPSCMLFMSHRQCQPPARPLHSETTCKRHPRGLPLEP
eukprot:2583568-Amphidinium_carterae.1